jgi:hypothetical protein
MKTIYVAFEKTIGCNLPVAVPDHWEQSDIRQALCRGMIHDPDLKDLLDDLDWEMEGDPRPQYAMTGVIEHYHWPEEPPVYAFPEEAPPTHPDQLTLLESAL